MKFNKHLEALEVYEAGKPIELVVREYGIEPSEVVKLASNENPYGTSPHVVSAIQGYAHQMYRYPDDSFYELKEALGKQYSVQSSQVIIGSGSDQVLEFICHAKLSSDECVVMNKITFAMYEIYAHHCGAKVIRTETVNHDADAFIDLCNKHNPAIAFICVPCNPLGDCLSRSEVYRILDSISSDVLVVIDGAYMEYASTKDDNCTLNPRDLIDTYKNVIYLGTFSKAYGLGGMRIGYGLACEEIISTLHKIRPPFNITTLSLKAAIEALKDQSFVQESITSCLDEMGRYEVFAQEQGLEYIPSYTNFITIYMGEYNSTEIFQALMRKGIIVRNLASYGLNALRITIGTPSQNDRFFATFAEVIK